MSIKSLPSSKTKGEYILEELRILLYGETGIGKSTFASRFKKCMFICTEVAHKHLSIYKREVQSWQDFLDIVELLEEGDHDFKTIVVDTFDNLFKFCVQYVCKKHKIEHPSDAKWGKGWDLLQRELEKPVLQLSMSNYGLILICQMKEVEIKTRHTSYTKMVSTLPNQGRKILMPFVDIIGCCISEEVQEGRRNKERRIMTFQPTEYVEAKDRTGNLPEKIPLKYKEFARYFETNIKEEEDS